MEPRLQEGGCIIMEHNGHVTEHDGYIMEQNVHEMEHNGHVMEQNGHVIERDGHVIERDGHVMERDGHIMEHDSSGLTTEPIDFSVKQRGHTKDNEHIREHQNKVRVQQRGDTKMRDYENVSKNHHKYSNTEPIDFSIQPHKTSKTEQNKNLQTMDSGTDDRNETCDVCSEGFEDTLELKEHIKTHISMEKTGTVQAKEETQANSNREPGNQETADQPAVQSETNIKNCVSEWSYSDHTKDSTDQSNSDISRGATVDGDTERDNNKGEITNTSSEVGLGLQDVWTHTDHPCVMNGHDQSSDQELLTQDYTCHQNSQEENKPLYEQELNFQNDEQNQHITNGGDFTTESDDEETMYYCSICGKELPSSTLQEGTQSLKCDVCNMAFIDNWNLSVQERTHTLEETHESEESFISRAKQMKMHGSFQCNVCGSIFSQKGNLVAHSRMHTDEKPFKCDICGREYAYNSSLRKHKQNHIGVKPYKCDICGKEFSQNSHLKIHIKTHSGIKPYRCDICGSLFTQKGNLITHERMHTGIKPYMCNICGKSCSRSNDLAKHMRTHTGEKPYTCDICGNSFTQKSSLSSHVKAHKGIKAFKCDVCGKDFVRSSDLLSHSRTHTGHRPFKCETCDKEFAQSSALSIHKRTHLGQKPYKCDVCGKGFSQSGHLSTHARTHTQSKPYICGMCGKDFSRKFHLIKHVKTHALDVHVESIE